MPRTVQQTSQDGRKNFHRRGISYRLIPLIILLGLILPLLAAAIHIREDYQKEKDNLAGTFKQIESVILPSLRQAAWIADRELLESNLRGVLNFPFIKYLEYRDRNNRLLVAARSSRPTDPITREYTLNYRYNDKDYNLGTLQVAASFDEAKSSLRTHFLEILLTLFLTALSISVSLVITFHFMINRHLTTMARYVQQIDFASPGAPLTLKRAASRHNDELDEVVIAINSIRTNLYRSFTELQQSKTELETEIAERQQTASELKEKKQHLEASLQEKEVLLREIHHRVKNNLQVVASLLRLQSQSFREEPLRLAFEESRDRVQAIGLVHELLYRAQNLAKIQFNDYVRELVDNIFRTYNVSPEKITCMLTIEPITLKVDIASPCGLILNELVSNALKHAFPEGGPGTIEIELTHHQQADHDNLQLCVRDNGIGLPDDLDIMNTDTLGLTLVDNLVRHQLHGAIQIRKRDPTEFRITFSVNNQKAWPAT